MSYILVRAYTWKTGENPRSDHGGQRQVVACGPWKMWDKNETEYKALDTDEVIQAPGTVQRMIYFIKSDT